jgi:hypothetical protein
MPERNHPDFTMDKRAPLPVPPAALAIQLSIVERLDDLKSGGCGSSPAAPSFQLCWAEIAGLFENYQQEIINGSSFRKSCKKGCATCCNHWVDEVYSFEAEIIADFLRKNCADEIPSIIARCREDSTVFDRLKGLVEQRLSGAGGDESGRVDARDLLLSIFYPMNRPCPLLAKGICIAYDVRPLSCRGYVSFSDARYCEPDVINDGEAATYLFGLEDEALELVETLHEKYGRFEGEYGLRKLLVKYLDKQHKI